MDLVLKKVVIPKSSRDCFIIEPYSKTFITGIAKTYNSDYNSNILDQYISESEYNLMLERFNNSLVRLWPCDLIIAISYLLSPLTCCLSFLIPNLCISDAEEALKLQIDYYNAYRLKERGLHVKLIKKYSTSWMELRVVSY